MKKINRLKLAIIALVLTIMISTVINATPVKADSPTTNLTYQNEYIDPPG